MNMHFVLVDCSNYTADRIVLSNPLRARWVGGVQEERKFQDLPDSISAHNLIIGYRWAYKIL